MQVKAAVVREKGGPFILEDLELEAPRDDEVLVEVVAAGMCHTDIAVRDQHLPTPLPAVLGHEGAGIVREVGRNVTKLAPGDHVLMGFAFCGQCRSCRAGALPYCYHSFEYQFKGSRPDGSRTLSKDGEKISSAFFHQSSFATYAIAPEKSTVKVSNAAPLEMLGPLACGVLTGFGAVVNSLKPRASSSIAIFGAGGVGLSAVMGAAVVGCSKIIVIDPVDSRLELAKELGATHFINPQKEDPVEVIQKLTGVGADFSLENSGRPDVMRQAVDCLNVRGVCGQIGATPVGTEAHLDMNTIMSGRTVRGIIDGDAIPDDFVPEMIDWYLAGRLPLEKIIRFYDFEDINQAAADVESGKTIKPILRIRK